MAEAKESNGDTSSIVIDNGSGLIKAGFAGDKLPKSILPSIVGIQEKGDKQTHHFGNKTLVRITKSLPSPFSSRNIPAPPQSIEEDELSLKRPIHHGIIKDWDLMEALWQYTFFERVYFIFYAPRFPLFFNFFEKNQNAEN